MSPGFSLRQFLTLLQQGSGEGRRHENEPGSKGCFGSLWRPMVEFRGLEASFPPDLVCILQEEAFWHHWAGRNKGHCCGVSRKSSYIGQLCHSDFIATFLNWRVAPPQSLGQATSFAWASSGMQGVFVL